MRNRKSARAMMIVAGGLVAAIPASTGPAAAQKTPGGSGIVTPCAMPRANPKSINTDALKTQTNPRGIVGPNCLLNRKTGTGLSPSATGGGNYPTPCDLQRKSTSSPTGTRTLSGQKPRTKKKSGKAGIVMPPEDTGKN
jgi:hypothetical protein